MEVNMVNDPKTWIDDDGVIYSADKKTLIKAQAGLTDYTIPEGTKAIGDFAFFKCYRTLKKVIIPNSVETIGNKAFDGCRLLQVTVPASVKQVADGAFRNVLQVKYDGKLDGFPWGALNKQPMAFSKKEDVNKKDEKPCYVVNHYVPGTPSWWGYTGEMLNGLPHGKGGYYDSHSGSPQEEGTYYKGKLVSGDRWTSKGVRYSPGGDTWNGYGTGVDSEGNVYTGNWIFGHTEEEFDELWHEIN